MNRIDPVRRRLRRPLAEVGGLVFAHCLLDGAYASRTQRNSGGSGCRLRRRGAFGAVTLLAVATWLGSALAQDVVQSSGEVRRGVDTAGLCVEEPPSEGDAAGLTEEELLLGSAASEETSASGERPPRNVAPGLPREQPATADSGATSGCSTSARVDVASAPLLATRRSRGELLWELEDARSEEKREQSLDHLKEAVRQWPDDEELNIALAIAYHRDENELWALKVLGEYQVRRPPACAAQTVEAWLRHRRGEPDEAAVALRNPACAAATPEVRARRHLILAKMAAERGDVAEAVRELGRARETGTFYEEDTALLDRLQRRYEPARVPLLRWRLAAAAGWTSNGLAGNPAEVDATAPEHSGLGDLGFDLDWTHDGEGMVRPTLELGGYAHRLSAEAAEELSLLTLSVRPGIILGKDVPRVRLGYRGETLVLEGGGRFEQGPLRYGESHAGELELAVGDGFISFVDAGLRSFREHARTRAELEQGFIGAGAINPRVQGALGVAARTYWARHRAYDQVGGTALGRLHVELVPDWQLRQELNLSVDDYPHSEGYFPSARGSERLEWSSLFSIGLWRRLGGGVFAAAEVSRSHRSSKADSYDYEAFRGILRLVWASDWQTASRHSIGAGDHAKLGWTKTGSQIASEQPDLRELLRRDRAVERGL